MIDTQKTLNDLQSMGITPMGTSPQLDAINPEMSERLERVKYMNQALAQNKKDKSTNYQTDADILSGKEPMTDRQTTLQSQLGVAYTPSMTGNPLGDAITNSAQSTVQLAKDVLRVINPLNLPKTASAIGNLALGVVDLLASKAGIDLDKQLGEDKSKYAIQVGTFYKNKYGTPQKFAEAIQYDPAGFASDILTLISGVGGVAKLGGKVANIATKTAKAGSIVAKVGSGITKATDVVGDIGRVADMIDPSNVIAKTTLKTAGKVVGGVAKKFVGKAGELARTEKAIGDLSQGQFPKIEQVDLDVLKDKGLWNKSAWENSQTFKDKITTIQGELSDSIKSVVKSNNVAIDAKNLASDIEKTLKESGYTAKWFDDAGEVIGDPVNRTFFQTASDGSKIIDPKIASEYKLIKKELDVLTQRGPLTLEDVVKLQEDIRKEITISKNGKIAKRANAYLTLDNMIEDYLRDLPSTKPIVNQINNIKRTQALTQEMEKFGAKVFAKNVANQNSIWGKIKNMAPMAIAGGSYVFGGPTGALTSVVGVTTLFSVIDWLQSPRIRVGIGVVEDIISKRRVPDSKLLEVLNRAQEIMKTAPTIPVSRVINNAIDDVMDDNAMAELEDAL